MKTRDRSGRAESKSHAADASGTATRSSKTVKVIGGATVAGTRRRCACRDLRLTLHTKEQRCQRRIARRMWKSSTTVRTHPESRQEMPQLDLRLRSRRDARTGVGTLGSGQQREGDTLSPAQSTFGTSTMATGIQTGPNVYPTVTCTHGPRIWRKHVKKQKLNNRKSAFQMCI